MGATDWLAVAALIVSAAALFIAVLSATYARATNQRDAQRRHEEIAPSFTAELEVVGEQHTRLWLTLSEGHVDLRDLDVEIIDDGDDGELVEFTPDQDGVAAGMQRPRRRASWQQLRRGERAVWRVHLPDQLERRAPLLRLRVSSRAPEGSWNAVVSTDVPHDSTPNIW